MKRLNEEAWALQQKVSLLMRGCSEHEQQIFREIWTRCMLNFDQFLMTQQKLRLGFLFTDLSQHFRIYLVVFLTG